MKKRLIINIIVISIVVILTALCFLYDFQIVKFISYLRNSLFDSFFLGISFASNVFIIFFFLTTLFLWKENKGRWVVPLWISGAISFIAGLLLKVIFRRHRPFESGEIKVLGILFNFMKNNFQTWNFSFPSFQAMFVFSAIPILNKEFGKFKYIWIVFACLVAFSRVYFGAHYLSDAIGGAIIGYLIGWFMVLIEERYEIGKKVIKNLK